MRILQLIDSLEAGGAERMAVNYANALQQEISFSALCVTRKEGALKESLSPGVSYVFLNKKKAIDFKALFKLRSYVKKNSIEFIHAHSSSFFIAVLLKFLYPKVKIIWHDHYGDSEFLGKRFSKTLKLLSTFFFLIISVNQKLKVWAISELQCKNVVYLPNFASFEKTEKSETSLLGAEEKRILCLANLRAQKGHFYLLEIAAVIKNKFPDWTFHLVGKDFEDEYSNALRQAILKMNLEANVILYGSKDDVQNVIQQSDICILTSKSEGLPVALLEYGFNSKAVISTRVGEIGKVVNDGENGFLVEYGDVADFVSKLMKLISNSEFRMTLGKNLNKTVLENYSESGVLHHYIQSLH